MKANHDADCDIYASLSSGRYTDGVCTCGYALQCRRQGNDDKWYSLDRRQRMCEHIEHATFGRIVLELTKESIVEGYFNVNAEDLADHAVRCGLIQHVPYDPSLHGKDFYCDTGDLIYYWGDPTTPAKSPSDQAEEA